MVFSPLIAGTIPHHNKRRKGRGGQKIIGAVEHHWADTTFGGEARLKNPSAAVSANYLIYNDGKIVGQVPEEDGAWTSGGAHADNPRVTVEIQNSTRRAAGKGDDHPDSWKVSDAALRSWINLLADVFKRNGIAKATHDNLREHRDFQATACPGGYLRSKKGYIIDEVNKILSGGKPAPAPQPQPAPSKPSGLPPAGVAMLDGVRLNDHLSIRDWWTYSDAALTKKVSTVTAVVEVVGIDYTSRGGVEPSLRVKDSAGDRRWIHFSAVAGATNKPLTRFGSAAPARKSNDQVAREIINGVNGKNPWGNGSERKRKLEAAGYNYSAVQRRVNEILAGK